MTLPELAYEIAQLQLRRSQLAREIACTSDDKKHSVMMKQLGQIEGKLERQYRRRTALRSASQNKI